MELKTSIGNKVIQAKDIDYILRGKIRGQKDTLVKLKTGEVVLLRNSEEEIMSEMNNPKAINHPSEIESQFSRKPNYSV